MTIPKYEPYDFANRRHIGPSLAEMEEMLAACVELGARFMVCEMGLRALNLTGAELRADVAVTEGGLVTLLAEADGDNARIVFI